MTLLRVLLACSLPDGARVSWSEAASTTAYPEDVDGWTNWSTLSELRPGVDVATLPSAPAGRVDERTARALRSSLGSEDVVWFRTARWDLGSQTAVPTASPEVGLLVHMLALWAREGFSGRAECAEAVIEAPAYADSLLITCGPVTGQRLLESQAEVFVVSRNERIPLWTD